ncbi:zinc finger protein [Forsythia ovata]|uniref:Zinc finger protein n=1 Tax=Forsythia ovata TaxID=205694 RepID=A0ABD1V0R6_9LAMI
MNSSDMWESRGQLPLEPLCVTKTAGRPKKLRHREPDELQRPSTTNIRRFGMKMTCKQCGQTGHNKRSCNTRAHASSKVRSKRIPQPQQAVNNEHDDLLWLFKQTGNNKYMKIDTKRRGINRYA